MLMILPLAIVFVPVAMDAALFMMRPLREDAATCRIVSVTDGDTLRLWCPPRPVQSARLLGFDTPELFSPDCPSERLRAVVATVHLRRILLTAGSLRMIRQGVDRYDRSLVGIWVDGTPLSIRMVAAGLARPYDGGRRFGWC